MACPHPVAYKVPTSIGRKDAFMTDRNFTQQRRSLLTVLAGASVAASAAAEPPNTVATAIPPNTWSAGDRAALRKRAASEGDLCYLAEPGREGGFAFRHGHPPAV